MAKLKLRCLLILSLFYVTKDLLGQLPKAYSHPLIDDEFIGPFPSWINIKTAFNAVGDGIHDDTHAIQAAFDSIGIDKNHHRCIAYFPAGTYRITSTLYQKNKIRIGIIGENPASTKIIWDGPKDGTMFFINGVGYSRFNRICWDGNKIAKYAIDESWDGKQDYFDTGNEFADDEFVNVAFGIHGGFRYGISFAEIAIMRCKFVKNTVAGVSVGNFNALDIWIWNSIFEDCAIGATNDIENGAGNFKIYNSIFRRSAIADVKIGNTGEFSFRDNTSIGSKTFIAAGWSGNACSIIIQANKILDPKDKLAINIENQGQVTLLDNVFRSLAGANSGPVVSVSGHPNSDLLAIGNTFTVSHPIVSDRNIIVGSSIVAVASLQNLAEQKLPGTQPNLHRTIFEVPADADEQVLQATIDQASELKGQRPVVHIPAGNHAISKSIVILPGSDVQLVGDSYFSALNWSNQMPGTVLRIEGPTKVTIRDILINGQKIANGILATNVDQVGARVFSHESVCATNNINQCISGLANTLVLLTNAFYPSANKQGILVIGGSQIKTGMAKGQTIVFGGCGYDNKTNFEVRKGASVLFRDTWYESKFINQFLKLSGSAICSVEGSHIANTNKDQKVPIVHITDFSGNVVFLSSYITGKIALTGKSSNTNFLGLGIFSELNKLVFDSSQKQARIRNFNFRSRKKNTSGAASIPVINKGSIHQNHIQSMLTTARNTHVTVLNPLPAGITDLRMYRVFTEYCLNGMEFRGPDNENIEGTLHY